MASPRISVSLRGLAPKSSSCTRLIPPTCHAFHKTTVQSAKPRPRPAPSTRWRQSKIENSDPKTDEDFLTPGSSVGKEVEIAAKAKGITISSDTAFEFLRAFRDLGIHPPLSHVRSLSERLDVSPWNIYALAKILNKGPSIQTRIIARNLLNAAASMGDPSAAINTIQSPTLDLGKPNQSLNREILSHLETFVKEDKNPLGLLAAGALYEKQGKIDLALKVYERAVALAQDPEVAALSENNIINSGESLLNKAYITLARLKWTVLKDKTGAIAVLEKSAELDNPEAFLYIAELLDDRTCDKYRDYLMIAASSGVTKAAYRLGLYYLETKEKGLDSGSVLGKDRDEREKMAIEWFSLGAAHNLRGCKINLALLLRIHGEPTQATYWLLDIVRNKTVPLEESVARIQEMWADDKYGPDDYRNELRIFNKDVFEI